MATIGLDMLYYATITENADGEETYGTPKRLAKAISADISIELAEAMLYADDGVDEAVKEFKSGTLSLGVNDIGPQAASDLTGATIDSNGVVVSTSQDGGKPVAVGFRAKNAKGKYRYFWLYRVQFGIPATNLATKGDSITFSTPTIEGTIMRRNKVDASGKNPWKAEVTEGKPGVSTQTTSSWYNAVYEPTFVADSTNLSTLSLGNVSLSPEFDANTLNYSASTSNATNTINAEAVEDEAEVIIKVNNTVVESGSSATWQTGSNAVTITVTNGSQSKNYTVVVTKV